MAFDKNQLVMHQLQVKSKRLESGLERLVMALKDMPQQIPDQVRIAYEYALGCLGGDYLKKELFKTDAFERVVTELRDAKMMKAEVADKNIEVWKSKRGITAAKEVDKPSVEPIGELFSAVEAQGEKPVEKDEPKMAEITIVPVPDEPKKDVPPPPPPAAAPAPEKKPTMFGEVDRDGNIVPKKKDAICEYAAPVRVESKSGFQPSGISSSFGNSDGAPKRGPIFCY